MLIDFAQGNILQSAMADFVAQPLGAISIARAQCGYDHLHNDMQQTIRIGSSDG
jgi:hypothetical protein